MLKGVLGVLPGVVATLQANEVIKVLLNIGNIASGRLILFDALQLSFREVSIKKRNDYEIKELIDYNQFCGVNEMTNNDVDDITVFDLKEKFDKEDTFELIDVREPHEYDICAIESAVLIPMGDLEDSLESLDKSKSYVVHCKSGGRSARAVAMMKEYGFQNVVNLAGGILSWADNIDTALNKY